MRLMRALKANGSRPTVSVVIPCYNYGRYLAGAVTSALSQPGVDVDVIIVDDASTDGSVDIARSIMENDPRVQVVGHAQNMGHIATYNDGLSRVTGEFVVLLSADDLLAPGALGRACALMRRFPDVGLVYGYAQTFADNPPPTRQAAETWSVWDGTAWITRMCHRGINIIVNPEVVMRRSTLDRVGAYAPDMPHSADMDLWLRAASTAKVGRINGPTQAYYRVHAANMHLNELGGILVDAWARRATFDHFFDHEGAALSEGRRLRETARRAIARELLRAAADSLTAGGRIAGAGTDALVDAARQMWPGIIGTVAWRQFGKRSARPVGRLQHGWETRISAARIIFCDWRWKRFGT